MPNKRWDIAWLAGIIDGEGSIVFVRNKPAPRAGRHQCRLLITNTDEGIVNEVKRILGEWLVFCTTSARIPQNWGHKVCYTIEVNRQAEICFVLAQVKPYLKSVKRDKIKLILDYMNEKDALGRNKNTRKKNIQYGLEIK